MKLEYFILCAKGTVHEGFCLKTEEAVAPPHMKPETLAFWREAVQALTGDPPEYPVGLGTILPPEMGGFELALCPLASGACNITIGRHENSDGIAHLALLTGNDKADDKKALDRLYREMHRCCVRYKIEPAMGFMDILGKPEHLPAALVCVWHYHEHSLELDAEHHVSVGHMIDLAIVQVEELFSQQGG